MIRLKRGDILNKKTSEGNMEHRDIIAKSRDKYTLLAMDTTKHCNARCKFCFNDWSKLKPAEMTEDTFKKVLKLLPLLPKDGFYLSCLYEPTIYNDFFEYLTMIPKGYEEKIFFTTNLVKELSDEQIDVIASANIDHINVSLETFVPEVYQELVGIKNTHLYENLEKLSFRLRDSDVKLRLITMLTQSNKDEMASLVKNAHNKYKPFEHEIRTPFPPPEVFTDEATLEKYESELLTEDEIQTSIKQITDLGYDNILLGTEWNKEKYYESNRQTRNPESIRNVKYDIRIEADGEVHFGGTDYYFSLDDIDGDVEKYFRDQLLVLQEEDTENYRIDSMNYKIINTDNEEFCSLDSVELYDEHYLVLKGWDSILSNSTDTKKPVIYIKKGLKKELYYVKAVQRMDVVKALNRDDLQYCGFQTHIKIKNKEFLEKAQIYIGYIDDGCVLAHRLPYILEG